MPKNYTEVEKKEMMGEDFEAFQEFQAQKAHRALIQKAKDSAKAMVSEGGKYYESYNRLDTQLNAIWDKAQKEARKAVGLEVEAEEKE